MAILAHANSAAARPSPPVTEEWLSSRQIGDLPERSPVIRRTTTTTCPALEAAGYVLRVREPDWYDHGCLHGYEPMANVHVLGPDCDERRIAAEGLTSMAEYAARKSDIVIDILRRAGLG